MTKLSPVSSLLGDQFFLKKTNYILYFRGIALSCPLARYDPKLVTYSTYFYIGSYKNYHFYLQYIFHSSWLNFTPHICIYVWCKSRWASHYNILILMKVHVLVFSFWFIRSTLKSNCTEPISIIFFIIMSPQYESNTKSTIRVPIMQSYVCHCVYHLSLFFSFLIAPTILLSYSIKDIEIHILIRVSSSFCHFSFLFFGIMAWFECFFSIVGFFFDYVVPNVRIFLFGY